jgi:hypothetical protein
MKHNKEEEMFTLNLRRLTRSYWIVLGLLLLIGAAWLCKPQIGVKAQVAEQSFYRPEPWAQELTYQQKWGPEHPRMLADINGDGKQDVVGFGEDGVWTATSTGANFNPGFALAQFGYQQSWRVEKHVRATADINGDGRDDIVGFGDDGVWTALSTGGGFAPASFVFAGFGYLAGGWRVDRHLRLLADVNGDGRKDIVAFGDDGVWIALATGSGAFSDPAFVIAEFGFNQGWRLENHVRTTADVNGDGLQDIVGFANDGVYVAFATGGGGFGPAHRALEAFGYYAGAWRVDRHLRLLADINRDGLQDIVAFGDDGVWVARSTGSGFESPQFVLAAFGYNQGWRIGKQPRFVDGRAQIGCGESTCKSGAHPRFVADLNGDGYLDIVGFGDEWVYRALGGPGGFEPMRAMFRALVVNSGFPWNGYEHVVPNWYPRLVGDVNGDGMQDLVAFDYGAIKVARSSNLPPPPIPAAPFNVRITAKTDTTLTVAWNDNSVNEDGFVIHLREGSGGYTPTSAAAANATSRVLSGLDPDTFYCVKVQATSFWGDSYLSDFVCDRTSPAPPPPPPPPPPPSSPFISASVYKDPGSAYRGLHISGSGFQPLEEVSLKIVTTSEDSNPFTQIRQTTANSGGGLKYEYTLYGDRCYPVLNFAVQATGLTSGKKSNVTNASCY